MVQTNPIFNFQNKITSLVRWKINVLSHFRDLNYVNL